jgi:hypothetical protein
LPGAPETETARRGGMAARLPQAPPPQRPRRRLRRLAAELAAATGSSRGDACAAVAAVAAAAAEPVWYVAIGSMMNPTSLANRGLAPLQSVPVEVLDFELIFRGHAETAVIGMAFASPRPRSTFHAVLHLMSAEDMAALDRMEPGYARVNATCRRYDGEEISATIYTADDLDERPSRPPEQRYIDLLIEGCQHYGVDPSAVEQLQHLDALPHPLPSEFQSFVIPTEVEVAQPWTEEQLLRAPQGQQEAAAGAAAAAAAGASGRVLAMNGKVLEYIGPDDWPIWSFYSQHLGTHLELMQSKTLYDPRHGSHDVLCEFTREHCACMEDWLARNCGTMWKVIGLLPQEYAD